MRRRRALENLWSRSREVEVSRLSLPRFFFRRGESSNGRYYSPVGIHGWSTLFLTPRKADFFPSNS